MKYLYFDLETTGGDTEKDRIVQLGIIVEDEHGDIEVSKQAYLNPEMPISPEATAVHGIKDADVADKPTFKQFAKALKTLFEDKIIVGYNSMAFDIPILLAEFDRVGVEVNLSGQFLDVFKIEKTLAPRSLAATYKKYTGLELEGAHDAMIDIRATKAILDAQRDVLYARWEEANALGAEVPDTFPEEWLYEYSGTDKLVDFYGKFDRDTDGWLIFKFGKHVGKRIIDETKYADWMLETFPAQIKKLIREDRARFNQEQFKR